MENGTSLFVTAFLGGCMVGFLFGYWAAHREAPANRSVGRGEADGSWGGSDADSPPPPIPEPTKPKRINGRTMWD